MEIDTSDVPNNPISELFSMIKYSLDGLESEVFFHLEPNYYIFKFSPKDDLFMFQILYLEKNKKTLVKKIKGNLEQIIIPFYQALKKFSTLKFEEKNLEKIENSDIKELEELIHKFKTGNKSW